MPMIPHTDDVSQTHAAHLWRTAVALAATNARQALPDSNGRIDKAIELVLTGAVELLENGTARVTSQHNGRTAYVICNGTCDCPDFERAPAQWCKHRLGRAIALRATQLAEELGEASPAVTLGPEDLAVVPDAEPCPKTGQVSIPPQFLVEIQGKPFVTFHGLLHLAHQHGLLSLTEEVTHVTDSYVMAQARAEFADGRVFRSVGDSAPENVGAKVKPHWRRLAGTRAMARALRNALNVNLVALEELAE